MLLFGDLAQIVQKEDNQILKHKIGLIAALLLVGCDSQDYINEVKQERAINYSALTNQEIFENRKLCIATEWRAEKIRNTPTVHYTCTLKNEDGISRAEKIVWERNRAWNGFALVSHVLEEYNDAGETQTIQLNLNNLMDSAVYDTGDLKKYLTLHLANK